ncbi:AfsR/SARP family transcriptional regulator [Thermogemmatispora aurantia]|nr:bacterial transcriptional activator domain-containing protein [Thermogemmatispora aurantia]
MERYPLTGAGQVRKLLGRRELLQTCGQGYQLADQGWIWTDVDEALRLVREARGRGLESLEALPCLQEAERLFRRGRLLEGQGALWAVAYREWVAGERWRAGLALGRLYERVGMESEAGEQYRQLYEEEPYKEEALLEVYGWWMRQGERERAERVLEAGLKRLEQEGVPLTAEGKEQVRRLREQGEGRTLVVVQGEAVVYWEGSKGASAEERREERCRKEVPQGEPELQGRLLPLGRGQEEGECGVRVLVWPLVWGRERRGSLQELEREIQEELKMSERREHEAETRAAQGQRLPRRQALLLLAGMPQVLLGLGSVGGGWGWEWEGMKEGRLREEVLPVVAGSITACWHLLNEGELEAVERTVGSYLPLLRRWAYEPSGVQQEAANLAAQGHLLLGFIAYHRLQFQQDLSYDQEGVALSRVSGVPALLVKALTCLGLDYYHLGAPLQMQRVLEEANRLLGHVPPVLHWAVYTGLALAYAKQGRAEEAVGYLSQAREWGDISRLGGDQLPVYLQADEGPWKLIVRESLVHIELSRHGEEREHALEAERALAQIEGWRGRIAVPERIRLEIVNRRGEAAIGRGELEEYVSYTVEGAEGARRLESGKRRQELVSNWRRALERWPGEKRVRELGELVLEM